MIFITIIKNKFKHDAKLLYSNTDSSIYQLYDVNKDGHIRENIHQFNRSDYQENNIFRIRLTNKEIMTNIGLR